MNMPVYNSAGEIVDETQICDGLFAIPFNMAVVHQATVRQLANRRVGTASTKTRSDVAGSTRKLFRQKHTGRARRGGLRAPLLRGGGVVFGPHPRSYRQKMPKKMRRLALKCTLSAKVRDEQLTILDDIQLSQAKTKGMVEILRALEVDSSVLVVTSEANQEIVKSARNLQGIKTLPVDLLNVVDVMSYRRLLITLPAVRKAEEIWGNNASV